MDRTWQAAAVSVPVVYTTHGKYHLAEPNNGVRRIDEINKEIRPGVKIPTIIFLHGAGGVGPPDSDFERAALKAGYAVIAPKHYRRRDPGGAVDSKASSSGTRLEYEIARAQRTGELKYALTSLSKISWVDLRNIVIAGYGQGSIAVHTFPAAQPQVNGAMMFSSICNGPESTTGSMIHAGKDVPILYVLGKANHFWLNVDSADPCDDFVKRPQPSTYTIVEAGLNPVGMSEVQKLIVSHLKAWRR